MADNDWKSRLGMVYSTNPDFRYDTDEEPEAETLPDAELPAPLEQAAQPSARDRASARAAIRFHVLCFKRFTPSGWF